MKKSILKLGLSSLFVMGLCISKPTEAQTVTTIGGLPGTADFNPGTVPWADTRFNLPYGIGVDSDGNLFVADTYNHNIRKFHSNNEAYFRAGKPGDPATGAGDVDQNGIQSRFWNPSGIDFDADNNMYVADEFNNKIRSLSRFISLGQVSVVSTVVGRGSSNPGSNDGGKASATLDGPRDVAVASNGDVYICDTNNDLIRVWNGSTLTTIAGSTSGYQDGPGSSAQFFSPRAIEFDNNGDLLVADFVNSCVRKVNIASSPQYEVSTIAGNANSSQVVDGDALTTARFRGPSGLAVDASGNVFITDAFNGNTIRRLSNGQVTTIAGKWQSFTLHQDGQDTASRFSNPAGITFNVDKNVLYVADQGNHVIRQIVLSAIADFEASKTNLNEGEKISLNSTSSNAPDTYQWTITPSAGVAFSDGTSQTSPNPSVIFNNAGTYTVELEVTNSYGNDTRTRTDYITVGGGNVGIDQVYSNDQVKVYPNPTEGQFNVQIIGQVSVEGYSVFDLTGREVLTVESLNTGVKNLEVNLENFQKGFYIVNILTDKNTISKKILVH